MVITLVAVDCDGTADAAPTIFLSLMQALRAAGHRVVVITGDSATIVTQQSLEDKATYLQGLGLGDAYDELVVIADPPHEAKAQWLKDNGADLLIDNDRQNAELASASCLVLLPWATRVGNKNGGE